MDCFLGRFALSWLVKMYRDAWEWRGTPGREQRFIASTVLVSEKQKAIVYATLTRHIWGEPFPVLKDARTNMKGLIGSKAPATTL